MTDKPDCPKGMEDLYTRLAAIGFDRAFVRDCLLPDWWEDKLAEVPANRALAEASIAKTLKIPLRDLRDPSKRLELNLPREVEIKTARESEYYEVNTKEDWMAMLDGTLKAVGDSESINETCESELGRNEENVERKAREPTPRER